MQVNKYVKLNYSLNSPIHIGFNKSGFVNKTRYYIPGYTIAGAMVFNLSNVINLPIDTILNKSMEYLFVSTFFFKDNSTVFFPNLKDHQMGNLDTYDFESKYLQIYQSTSIDPSTYTAKESHLFEYEFIFSPSLMVEGVIAFDDTIFNFNSLIKALSILNVGGKISKGNGLMTLQNYDSLSENEFYNYLNCTTTRIPIAVEFLKCKYLGNVEPLTLNRYDEHKGFGQKTVNYGYYLMPGSFLEAESMNMTLNNYFSLK